jgi:hypothetical protein
MKDKTKDTLIYMPLTAAIWVIFIFMVLGAI